MVYNFKLKDIRFTRSSVTSYKSIYNQDEVDKLIEIYSRGRAMNLFNGCAIRLESLETKNDTTVIGLSKLGFYDLIVTNVLKESYESVIDKCVTDSERALVNRLIERLEQDGSVQSIEDIVQKEYLSNILAVSIVMSDLNGDILLMQRGDNVAVCAGIMGVSATGVLDDMDFDAENPFVNCAIREIKEELGLEIKPCNVHIRSLVAGYKKMQPIVLCDVEYIGYFEELIKEFHKADDFYKENKSCVVMSKDEVRKHIDDFIMTEAAKEHLSIV